MDSNVRDHTITIALILLVALAGAGYGATTRLSSPWPGRAHPPFALIQAPRNKDARVDILEDFATVTRAMATSNRHWISRLQPMIWAAGGIAFYLVLVHSTEVMKFIRP